MGRTVAGVPPPANARPCYLPAPGAPGRTGERDHATSRRLGEGPVPRYPARSTEPSETATWDAPPLSLTIVDKARLLRGVPLLSEIPTEVLADLATLATVQRIDDDTRLFGEGDPADAFYVVIEGGISGARNGRRVFRVGPGHEVGALAVLDDGPRAFSARAERASMLLRVGAEDFLYLLEQYPALARGVIRHLSTELRAALGGDSRYLALEGD